MTDQELIARLRNLAVESNDGVLCGPALGAADRIEAQTAEIERLRGALAKAGRDLNMARYGQPYFAWLIHKQAMADIEAKLAKAVEGLTVIDALDPEGLVTGCSQSAVIGLVLRMGEIARATLAELKGDKP